MGVVDILFNPNGRIRASEFWRGVIVLVGLQILLYLGIAYVSPWFILLYMPLFYPYLCVYGKRLHDSSKTAWIFLGFLVASIILGEILGNLLSGFSNIDQAAVSAQMEIFVEEKNFGGIAALLQDTIRQTLVLQFVSAIATNVIVGFFCARLWSCLLYTSPSPRDRG